MIFSRKPRTSPEPADVVQSRKRESRFRLLLCVLSGLMLGFSFPPSPLGILACFGLVPLLIVLAEIDRFRASVRSLYLIFFIFHLITLNWTGGYAHGNDVYMMIAGAITILLHPLFYFIPLFVYMYVKRGLGEKPALVALPFAWVGYEYLHSLSEWSFPWLTIGNSQSYDLARVQFISATGVYGLSFWVILINVLAFLLYSSLARRESRGLSRDNIIWLGLLIVLYFLPALHGSLVLSRGAPEEHAGQGEAKRVTVGMVQSNVDPWEKWNRNGYATIDLYQKLTQSLVDRAGGQRPDLILWPETAIPFLLSKEDRPTFDILRAQVNRIGVPILTGLPFAVFYADSTKAPPSAKRSQRSGQRYDSYNAAAFLQPGVEEIPWYGKMKMVPLAERVPYADYFHYVDFLRWGVGIGGWQIGPDSTIFIERRTGTRFCTMICYESVYPGFVASFVRRGAEFIALITIDSWWDKMSGAYQHQQFAILRAVENRRWVARCAVGGISCYIDPYGRVYDKTELFTQTTLIRTIGRSSDLSFYTEHGDWLGEGCSFIGGLFLAAGLGQQFKKRKRTQLWQNGS